VKLYRQPKQEGEKMEFGSKYVYCYADSDEESVSDEEFNTGITDER